MTETRADARQLRSFGLIVGGVFALLGFWPMAWRGEAPRAWALILAGILVGPALVYPPILKEPFRLWSALGRILGWINTRIILSIVFYGMFAPIGLVLRLMGKDSMRRSFDPRAASYRQPRTARPGTHMKQQF